MARSRAPDAGSLLIRAVGEMPDATRWQEERDHVTGQQKKGPMSVRLSVRGLAGGSTGHYKYRKIDISSGRKAAVSSDQAGKGGSIIPNNMSNRTPLKVHLFILSLLALYPLSEGSRYPVL